MNIYRIEVGILDINDNAPKFLEQIHVFNISESSSTGERYPLPAAQDADTGSNSVKTYKLSTNEHFSIDVSSGGDGVSAELVLQKALDREKQAIIKLALTAVDGGKPAKSGTMQILVNVIDVNDNTPSFSKSLYKVSVSENVAMGTTILKLNATDLDDGPHSDIRYSLMKRGNVDSPEKFTVIPESGEIIVKANLDYEENNAYELRVRATDQGASPRSGYSKVLIEVIDVNDNAPEISVTSLMSPVKENAEIGTVVALSYKLSQNEHFSLDVQSGGEHGVSAELVLQKALDREKQSVITLLLTAVDGGKPPRSGSLQIYVNVIDVNDNIPTFSKSLYKVRVIENATPGAFVIKLNATDLDEGMNSKILYSFIKRGNIDPSNIFDLNSETGEITVKGRLDYEETPAYEVRVQAMDQGAFPRSAHAKLLIEVIDVNDNAPEISVTSLMTPVKEDAELGTIVALVTVRDNGRVVYSFVKRANFNPADVFFINAETGEITVKGNLDYEAQAAYEVHLQATDKGSSPRSTNGKLLIEVVDVNDNAPEIVVTSLMNPVREDADIGSVVALVTVTDKDGGKNGQTRFVDGPLDRETCAFYNVTIAASDEGSPSLSSTSVINVEVSDVNDNAPRFLEPVINIYVKENSPVGARIYAITAVDPDVNENARVTYSLTGDSKSIPITSFVNINSETGDIISLQSFNYEELKTFQFKVQATDSGVPPLSSNVTVNVLILDENDNNPTILAPYSEHGSVNSESIPYSAEAGYFVAKIRAVDADSGYNKIG
uniref:Cadherin domain-containing protein n=1 Tax=Stegastes partitus TaxID=144197 RepID=A0A3B5A1W1_9TELE